jgi:hypothetical protein
MPQASLQTLHEDTNLHSAGTIRLASRACCRSAHLSWVFQAILQNRQSTDVLNALSRSEHIADAFRSLFKALLRLY